jgi:hypothetical protein
MTCRVGRKILELASKRNTIFEVTWDCQDLFTKYQRFFK